jgi:hypothetical protein
MSGIRYAEQRSHEWVISASSDDVAKANRAGELDELQGRSAPIIDVGDEQIGRATLGLLNQEQTAEAHKRGLLQSLLGGDDPDAR